MLHVLLTVYIYSVLPSLLEVFLVLHLVSGKHGVGVWRNALHVNRKSYPMSVISHSVNGPSSLLKEKCVRKSCLSTGSWFVPDRFKDRMGMRSR